MPGSTNTVQPGRGQGGSDDLLHMLVQRPAWMMAALQPEQVLQALARQIPEVAAGALRLIACDAPRLFLKDTSGRWRGTYQLTVEGLPGQARQAIPIRVTLTAPGIDQPVDAQAQRPFPAEGWACDLPELRLHCELEPAEQALEILPQLTDPERSRALLAHSIGAGGPAYHNLRIQSCQPEVLDYKPGSRCTIRYHLRYAAEDAGRGWPTTVIAKTYRGSKGEQAYDGMVALWSSPLSRSRSVRIAEPLAYVPELKLLIQATLPEEQTLEAFLRSALRARTPATDKQLRDFVRATATGLAELHLSGAHTEATVTWDERLEDIPKQLERIAVVAPKLAQSVAPLLDRLHARGAAHPADPAVPSHGSFDSDQVLIAQGRIGFIDFDNFCMAEPALDVGHFRAAIMDSGMKLIDPATLRNREARQAYLDHLNELGDEFLAQYEALAPISRQRLALWEEWDYLRDTLQLWTKPMLAGAEAVASILAYHLHERQKVVGASRDAPIEQPSPRMA